MPSVPDQEDMMKLYSAHGYWVFFPRYKGTWESPGTFLEKSPVEDIQDVITGLSSSIQSIWDKRSFLIPGTPDITVIGSSFGGAVAILVSSDSRVQNVIALSPVVDWGAQEETEDLDSLLNIVQEGFGCAYRVNEENWSRMQSGDLLNPVSHTSAVEEEQVLIFYSENDSVVSSSSIKRFVSAVGCRSVSFDDKGHLGGSSLVDPDIMSEIQAFIENR